jgi:hypothetical protein
MRKKRIDSNYKSIPETLGRLRELRTFFVHDDLFRLRNRAILPFSSNQNRQDYGYIIFMSIEAK